jgi:hypothetical protein
MMPPMPAGIGAGATDEERTLYLTPKGRYTAADIRANGPRLPSEKFKGILASHNMNPRKGEPICPITHTASDARYTWIVGGQSYQFCCPPCIDEFVRLAREKPETIRAPEAYVKQ